MTELTEHPIYSLLDTTYRECLLDFVVLQPDGIYEGTSSHKQAVLEAFRLLNGRKRISNHWTEYGFQVTVEPEKMEAHPISWEELVWLPENFPRNRKHLRKLNQTLRPSGICWDVMSLGYAFLSPPYGVPYYGEDLARLCQVLFPNPGTLEILSWNDTWSNYFDDGNEWWGTACWSVYDQMTGLFVVIGASLSD